MNLTDGSLCRLEKKKIECISRQAQTLGEENRLGIDLMSSRKKLDPAAGVGIMYIEDIAYGYI